jgi:3-methylcrotonyl-CoA carboxylase alpha subunit
MPAQIAVHLQCNGESRLVRVDATSTGSSSASALASTLAPRESEALRRPKAIRQGRTLYLQWNGELQAVTAFDPIAEVEASHQHQGGLTAPMNGSIVRVLIEPGQQVEAGATLVVLEAMKMEHSIRAQQAGVVKGLFCAEGDMVNEGAVLLEMEDA